MSKFKFTAETEEIDTATRSPDPEHRQMDSEAKSDTEYTERLTETEMDDEQQEPQSAAETEYPTELESVDEGRWKAKN